MSTTYPPATAGDTDPAQARISILLQSRSRVFSPDDQQRRGKFVEIDRHPILILDLLPIFINLKDAAARVYEHFQIILFPDEVLPQKPGLFVGHGQYHLR